MKIGEHEIEADGPYPRVEAQIEVFSRLIGRGDALVAPQPKPVAPGPKAIHSVACVEGKLVRLSVQCPSASNAVLALLLGHRELRGNHAVSGTDIMQGLRRSGHNLRRVDTLLQRYSANGSLVISGKYRTKRYRLTTDGVANATAVVKTLAGALA